MTRKLPVGPLKMIALQVQVTKSLVVAEPGSAFVEHPLPTYVPVVPVVSCALNSDFWMS